MNRLNLMKGTCLANMKARKQQVPINQLSLQCYDSILNHELQCTYGIDKVHIAWRKVVTNSSPNTFPEQNTIQTVNCAKFIRVLIDFVGGKE